MSISNVMVFGYFGFENFGDELLLDSILQVIERYGFNNINKIFVLYNFNKENFFGRYNILKKYKKVILINRWSWIKIFFVILVSDVLICSGGLFQDKTSLKSLIYYLAVIKVAKVFNKKVFVLGTEMDVSDENKWLVEIGLKNVDFMGVRNKKEYNSKNFKTEFLSDISFLQYKKSVKDTTVRIVEENSSKKREKIGFMLKTPSEDVYNDVLNAIVNVCKNLVEEYDICFFPLCLENRKTRRNDFGFVLDILKSLDIKNIECRVWDDASNFMNIFSGIDFAVVSRFHGIVVCLMLGISFLNVSKESKILNFLEIYPELRKLSVSLEEINSEVIKRYSEIDKNKFESIVVELQEVMERKIKNVITTGAKK